MKADRQRVVLITGAGGGVGYATLCVFASCGWRAIGVDRRAFDKPVPANSIAIQADISIEKNLQDVYEKVRTFSPVLDAVINNAAMQIAKPLIETTAEEWDEVMAYNLRSVFLGAKLAYPMLKAAGGGAIVNVSSVHAVSTSANIASYAASKGGLLALTRAMAIEFAADNIRVNAILPGAVDTPMLRASMARGNMEGADLHDRLENLARKTVNGRVGKPEEIARHLLPGG